MVNTSPIFNPNLGISDILPPLEEGRLPQARPLAGTGLSEAGLEELFTPANVQTVTLRALCPRVSDAELLRPDFFLERLRRSLDRLSRSRDKRVRRFVRDTLGPLMENHELLKTYVNLAVDG